MNTTNNPEENPEAEYDPSVFPRPSVTADIALFTVRDRTLQVLLVRRKEWPFAGQWAVPGGFVRPEETLEDAARRELAEETGVSDVLLEQLRTFSEPNRDPRTWVITVAFTALVASDTLTLRAGTDAAEVAWFRVDALPSPLAFDHNAILAYALRSLQARLQTDLQLVAALLPPHFTLTEMQAVYETVSGAPLDKRNFRNWVLGTEAVVATGDAKRGSHRPALLYEFAPKKTFPS